MSAAGGLAFGIANFWLLSRIVQGITKPEGVKKWKIALLFSLKMGLLAGIFVLILKKGYVSPLPFLAGFTVSLIFGVAIKACKS